MGAVSTGNYHRQRAAVYLFVKSVNLSFILEFKSDVIKDVSSAKMSYFVHSWRSTNETYLLCL